MVVDLQNKNSYYGQDILKISYFVSSHFENPKVGFAGIIRMKVIYIRSEFSIYNVIEFSLLLRNPDVWQRRYHSAIVELDINC